MKGPPANACKNCIDAAVERRAAGAQRQRIEIALHRPTTLDVIARKIQIHHPVETNGIDFDVLDVAFQVAAGAARKPDDLRARHRAPHIGNDSLGRRNAPALEFVGRQNSCPGIEDLHSLDTGAELANEIIARSLDQNIDQMGERVGMTIGKQPRRRLVRRAVAGDHVGRNGPGPAAEAEKRHGGGSSALTRRIVS